MVGPAWVVVAPISIVGIACSAPEDMRHGYGRLSLIGSFITGNSKSAVD